MFFLYPDRANGIKTKPRRSGVFLWLLPRQDFPASQKPKPSKSQAEKRECAWLRNRGNGGASGEFIRTTAGLVLESNRIDIYRIAPRTTKQQGKGICPALAKNAAVRPAGAVLSAIGTYFNQSQAGDLGKSACDHSTIVGIDQRGASCIWVNTKTERGQAVVGQRRSIGKANQYRQEGAVESADRHGPIAGERTSSTTVIVPSEIIGRRVGKDKRRVTGSTKRQQRNCDCSDAELSEKLDDVFHVVAHVSGWKV